jgi:hypothetical protein
VRAASILVWLGALACSPSSAREPAIGPPIVPRVSDPSTEVSLVDHRVAPRLEVTPDGVFTFDGEERREIRAERAPLARAVAQLARDHHTLLAIDPTLSSERVWAVLDLLRTRARITELELLYVALPSEELRAVEAPIGAWNVSPDMLEAPLRLGIAVHEDGVTLFTPIARLSPGCRETAREGMTITRGATETIDLRECLARVLTVYHEETMLLVHADPEVPFERVMSLALAARMVFRDLCLGFVPPPLPRDVPEP